MLQITLQTQIGSKVIYRDNFAIIQGTLKSGQATISPFPQGFTLNNTIILSIMTQNTDNTNWAIGSTFDTAGYVSGSLPIRAYMQTNGIVIQAKNVNLTKDESVYVGTVSKDFNFKLVLMKLPDISDTEYTLGDVNEDGQITQADLTLVQNYIQGTQALTDKQLKAADVNKDGSINTGDTLKLSQYINGTISSLE